MDKVSAASSEPSDCRISEPMDKRRFQMSMSTDEGVT